jgi:hypothetical protein
MKRITKLLLGRRIEHVILNEFDSGRVDVPVAHDPTIILDNGASIRFVVQETEVGEYGIEIVYVPNRKRGTK